ncbi:hypothetical protein CAJAP_04798 [Camponotus japonicus]
MIKPFKN